MKADTLEIVRKIPETKTTMKTACLPGVLTLLIDEAGDGVLLSYVNTFAGKDEDNRFSFQLGGAHCDPTKLERVGFGDRLPDDLSIAQYLLESGFGDEEAEKIIESYDLEQFHYLTCGALNATATRQLELLKALHSEAPVLLCNDPFQPFNGRWREDFAKLFLKQVEGSDRIIVVTNLSFMPQSWSSDRRITSIDVGKAAEVAIKKAEADARRKAALEEQRRLADAAAREEALRQAEAEAHDLPDREVDRSKEIPINLPDNFKFAYKAANDFIFKPLANLSNTFRTYSLLIVPGALVCIGLMIGLMMYPNMQAKRAHSFTGAAQQEKSSKGKTTAVAENNAEAAIAEVVAQPVSVALKTAQDVKAPEKLLVDPTPKVGKGEVPEKLRPAPLAEIQAVDLALLGRVLGQGVQPVECSVVSSSACSVNPDGSNLRSFCE